jgi:hypothetical protein
MINIKLIFIKNTMIFQELTAVQLFFFALQEILIKKGEYGS